MSFFELGKIFASAVSISFHGSSSVFKCLRSGFTSESISSCEVVNGRIIRVGIVDGEGSSGMVPISEIEGGLSCQGMLPIVVCELSGSEPF